MNPVIKIYKSTLLPVMVLAVTVSMAQVQNSPQATNAPAAGTATIAILPAAYPVTAPVNYVRSWQPLKPFTTEAAVTGNTQVKEVARVTQYLDGLGRPIQTVNWKAAPGEYDLVAPVVYDDFGREKYRYMPYASGNDGNFKADGFAASVYTGTGGLQQFYPGENYFYAQTNYEASPLNRVEKAMAPGNSWVGNNRGSQMQYLVNTVSDSVCVWSITSDALPDDADANPGFNIPASNNSMYAAGTLLKTITIDEHNHQVVEFKDKGGKVVLKKVQLNETITGSAYKDWLCTYYVYDDLGLLRFVLSPKAVQAVWGNSWSFTNKQLVADELCFRYEYDQRLRMIAKKVPGAGWVYMVYDQRDRLVYTQDAGLRSKNKKWWMATLYDLLNRPAQTAMLTGYLGTRATLQTFVNALADGVNTVSGAGSYVNTTAGAFSSSQKLSLYSVPANATFVPLTYTFYDNYSWTPAHAYTTANNSKLGIGGNIYGESLPASNSAATQGLATGSRVRVIENAGDLTKGNWLETVSYYDDKARIIQVNSDNYKGGQEVITSRFDFADKVVSSYQAHTLPSADISTNQVYTEMDYDQAGRVLQVRKTLNDNTASTHVVLSNTYNTQGQLQQKVLGPETQVFSYNVRGWLKGINWAGYANSPTATPTTANGTSWFAMDLSYDWGYAQNQYNGNISGMRWYTKGAGKSRSYGYGYDAVSRLIYGDFKQLTGSGTWNNTEGVNFSMQMGDGTAAAAYDANGNILAMQHTGWKSGASTVIDNLKYTYQNSGASNKLKNVVDLANDEGTKLGDFRTSKNSPNKTAKTSTTNYDAITDYYYDSSGNMIKDFNKDIGTADSSGIEYNYLNLPCQIKVYAPEYASKVKGAITYIYDATGNKLEKRVAENADTAGKGNKTTITSYAGGFVYENNVLQYGVHEEGRIRPVRNPDNNTLTGYTYDWFLKDHLGNVRVVLTEEKKTDVYPAATLEAGVNGDGLKLESMYYDIDSSNIKPTPVALQSTYSATPSNAYHNNNGIPNPNKYINTDTISTKMYKLNGTGSAKMGLGITLKVMAGDTVNVFGRSFWQDASWASSNDGATALSVLNILTGLLGGPSALGGAHGVTASQLNGTNGNISGINNLVNQQNSGTALPKAFINYMFFDEQFRYISGGYSQIGANGTVKNHYESSSLQNIPVDTNGYIYVYCSNSSAVDVYFDNLQVMLTHGPLVEETHYYPFGLTMAGISSRGGSGGADNKHKWNAGSELANNEFSDRSGLEFFETPLRSLDPQLGRWWQPDSKPDVEQSMYASMRNNPILLNDPLGDTTIYYDASGSLLYRSTDGNKNAVTFISDKNLKAFNLAREALDFLGADMNNDIVNGVMRMFGESYDVQGVFAFIDANEKSNPSTRTDIFEPTDGQGPLINEQSAAMEKKGLVWSPNPEKVDHGPGSPFAVTLQGAGVTMHTHDNEGRKINKKVDGWTIPGVVAEGEKSVGDDGDIKNAMNKPGTALYQMAVSKKSIYFYNSSGVILTISRDVFNSKNFKNE